LRLTTSSNFVGCSTGGAVRAESNGIGGGISLRRPHHNQLWAYAPFPGVRKAARLCVPC
jgi:hypothetical protein